MKAEIRFKEPVPPPKFVHITLELAEAERLMGMLEHQEKTIGVDQSLFNTLRQAGVHHQAHKVKGYYCIGKYLHGDQYEG